MNYVGLFEGISGFGLAFKRAGATIQAVCEIDKTCQSVLRRHHPEAEIISDVKTITKESFGQSTIDVLAGGFPCQDLSVAGLRKGLGGERSGLWFEFLRIITDHKPRIVVIENVPGLLSGCGCFSCQAVGRLVATHSRIRRRKGGETCAVCVAGKRMLESHSGRNLAVVLQGLAECGYGWAYRILDSQFDGVAQRRNRVFIVASLGTASCAEILFERESSAWDSPPSREAREEIAGTLKAGARSGGWSNSADHAAAGLMIPATLVGCRMAAFGEYVEDVPSSTIKQRDYKDATDLIIAPTLRSNGDAHSGLTTGDGLVVMPEICGALDAGGSGSPNSHGGSWLGMTVQSASAGHCFPVIPIHDKATRHQGGGETRNGDGCSNGLGIGKSHDPMFTLDTASRHSICGLFGVRRLTPTECERLQGFPDGWTAFGDDGKPISDSARYRMLGNAVCVPTAEWIARRIAQVEVA